MRIGKRVRIPDLKLLWQNEPMFSDWLMKDDGLSLLSEDLGIEVENLRREQRGANFPCDLLGNSVGDESHAVLIENQFGKTDHDHLGKFLTYAASQKALTCIWIAERISDDHRAAIDWLNANTPETFSFFAAELRAYRIEDSPAAPQLEVVCKPNLSIKPVRLGETTSERERHSWRQLFWEEIHDALRASSPNFRLQKAGTDSWSTITVGHSDIHTNMDLTPRRKCIGVSTIITGPKRDEIYKRLEVDREIIEAEMGAVLTWIPQRGEKSAAVFLEVNIDPKDDANRERVKDWFCEIVPRWHAVFSRYATSLKQLARTSN